MDFFISIFNTVLYQPLFNALVFLYNYLPGNDFGIAIIVLTILIRLILYPLSSKGIKSQKALANIQPKIKEIQEKYKQDKEKQTKELMELYKKEKINPFSGCLPLLIQLPIIIALYRVFWGGLDPEKLNLLYGFISSPGQIDSIFLGFLNLANPNIILAILVGTAQFIQIKIISQKPKKTTSNSKRGGFAEEMQKQMQYFMPVFIVLILWRLPSALGLYLLTTTLFTIFQQYIIVKNNHESREFAKN